MRLPGTVRRFPRPSTPVLWGVGLAVASLAIYGGAASMQQEKPSTRTRTCLDGGCHADIVGRPVEHDPVARRTCLECHEYADPRQHRFELSAPEGELCASCHALPRQAFVHRPVAAGDCTGCHDPHGSDQPLLMVEAPARLCQTCHDDDYDLREYVHGPVAVGACVVCHDAHGSPHENLLTDAPRRLCLDCHGEFEPTGVAARHLHRPLSDGCTGCHDPHASDHKYNLVKTGSELCLSCHEGVDSAMRSASVVHGPMTGEAGCTGCHEPHFASLPALQKAEQPQLCLGCHDRPLETPDGRMLTDMAALLAANENHHGPIREGDCTTCHQPHAGDRAGLLFQDYPPEFYAPFQTERYQLCFSCHLSDLVQDESGTGLTGFRDGDRNLHWLHVNQEKGRTCRACHEVHASKRPFHMRDAVPFGAKGWMLEINFEKTDEGGSCSPACHKPHGYDRSAAAAPEPTVTPTEGDEP